MSRKMVPIIFLMLSIFLTGCSTTGVNSAGSNRDAGTQVSAQPLEHSDTDTPTNHNVNSGQTKVDLKEKVPTAEAAIKIITEYIGTLPKGFHLDFDRMETIDNKDYYVIHHYEIIIDNEKSGDSHTATYHWYYVEKKTGEIFELDIPSNKLIKVLKNNNRSN